jgi:hypothetical protein
VKRAWARAAARASSVAPFPRAHPSRRGDSLRLGLWGSFDVDPCSQYRPSGRREVEIPRWATAQDFRYDRRAVTEKPPLPKDPVIEAYKKDVDVTLLLENLKRTPQERLDRMVSMLRLTEEMQRAMKARR